jgi:signal transduction histidine kinase
MNERGILIVEDENIVALDMRMRLESMGYHVLGVVDTGEAALDFIARNRPDLVLMDIKLKGGSDGIETARKARETIEIPIIFVTAFTDEGTLERAKLASPYGYVVKPFHERELRIAIELALYKFQYELSMRRSMEIAEEANKAKGEFLANVSHELKTPLNSIIGFTELSLDLSVDEEQREYLTGVIRSARSLVTLIDSILDFARLENGRLSPVQSSFSLDDLLGECVEFLAVGATSRNLEIFFRRDRRLPEYLVSDRSRIRQILMNLADNAVKFTEHGHISLAVDLAPPSALAEAKGRGAMGPAVLGKAPAALLLRLVVEDSGIGMAPDKIPKAFERFTQLDGSTTRPAGGTGIGLAIVAKSIDLLEGSILVQSAPGKGSRFEVLIPIRGDESRRSAIQAGLEGKRFFLVGFGQEARLDIEETLAWLGAMAEPREKLSDALASLEGRDGAFIIANEIAAAEDPETLSALRGRLVITCRPGFAGRAELTSLGIGIVPYPLRAAPLVATLASLSSLGAAPRGRAARLPPSPAPSPQPRPASRASPPLAEAREGSPGEDKAELGRFLVVLEACAASRDSTRLEMSCKEFRDLFRSAHQEAWERLAFSALLLSRKADWKGLEGIMEKGRLLADGKN